MKTAYFQCQSGASGDMMLGALVDAGLQLETLRQLLGTVPLSGYELRASQVIRHGLRGTKVDVILTEAGAEGHAGDPHHSHEHDHEGAGHTHDHDHPHGHQHEGAHEHDDEHPHQHGHDHPERLSHSEIHEHLGGGHAHTRNLRDISDLIQASGLAPRVKERAEDAFRRLAEAEARAHGCPVEEVHFHEVGAVDSIVDTVGVIAGLDALGIERVFVSPLNVGEGTVKTAHGVLPVPAPATAELLTGVPVYSSGVRSELVTPTAAAVLTTLSSGFGPLPAMRIQAIGYGAGTRDLPEQANLLRLVVGEVGGASDAAADQVVVVEANIDDMSPQEFEVAAERLFATGALDVYLVPVQMKKFRPGVVLTALAPVGSERAVADVLLRETTTLGVRMSEWQRVTAGRRLISVETRFGALSVKVGQYADGEKAMPEYEDCARLARQHGVPVREVAAAARAAYERLR